MEIAASSQTLQHNASHCDVNPIFVGGNPSVINFTKTTRMVLSFGLKASQGCASIQICTGFGEYGIELLINSLFHEKKEINERKIINHHGFNSINRLCQFRNIANE